VIASARILLAGSIDPALLVALPNILGLLLALILSPHHRWLLRVSLTSLTWSR
jgi:lipopolysaccharide export LptBFGC system permease protein LptF